MAQRGRPRRQQQTDGTTQQAASNGPSAERIAEVLAIYTENMTASRRIAQANNTLLTAFEKEGGDKAELKALHASLKLSHNEAVAKLERRIRYHAMQDIRVSWEPSGQANVLDALGPEQRAPDKNTKGQRDLSAARAHADGYNSGLNGGVPSDNPFAHAPGSEEYVRWHDGRDEGQQDRVRKNGPLSDRIAAAAVADAAMPATPAEASPIF
jgi:ribosome modulation factor